MIGVVIGLIFISPILRLMYLEGLKEFNFADTSKMESLNYRALVDLFWIGLDGVYLFAILHVYLNYGNPDAWCTPPYVISCVVVAISIMPPLTMPSILLILGGIGALCDLVIFLPVEIIRRKIYTSSPRTGE